MTTEQRADPSLEGPDRPPKRPDSPSELDLLRANALQEASRAVKKETGTWEFPMVPKLG
jgi:hypothetical protein